MPKRVIAAMEQSVRKAHPGASKKQVDREVYGRLNKMGAMHGSKETAEGRRYEAKYDHDHPMHDPRHHTPEIIHH